MVLTTGFRNIYLVYSGYIPSVCDVPRFGIFIYLVYKWYVLPLHICKLYKSKSYTYVSVYIRDPSRRRAKRTVDVQRGSVRNISPKVVLTRQRTKTASPKYKQRNRGHPTSYVVREGSLQNISPRVVFDPF